MKIKQQIWLAAFASILLIGSMITISIIYLEGAPLYLSLGAGTAGILLSTFFLVGIHRSLTRGIGRFLTISQDIAQGTLDSSGKAAAGSDELGQLAQSFYTLGIDLHHKTAEERSLRLKAEEQAWINTEVSEMALMLQGSVHLQTAARIFIGRLASAVGGSYGAVYLVQHNQLQFAAGYAFDEASVNREPFGLGSGLVGQCAVDGQMIVMHNLPENYVRVHSGLGEAVPSTLILLPVLYETAVVAVVELALMKVLADKELQLIERTGQNMGVLINTLADVARIEELLSETQMQKDELEAQTEELQAQTQELEAQTEELLAQTEELRVQTEELATSNNNLQQQMMLTEQQKAEIKAQAEEIFMAAQYKSEFLANVSHELRTPLNSLLILSQILAENKEGNLGVKQLEYVHTIFSAGKDLLQLIDEILDLAKLEVGKMMPVLEPVALHDVSTHLFRRFEQQAKKKNIRFDVHCDSRLPEHLMTDGHRLQQIINNLLSNAVKFTPEQGSVSLSIRPSSDEVIFSVSDTGIGIAPSKLDSIFEAFQQADGTTSRKYGGTGLGLTICRELATLLGGRIEVDSLEGKGSTFSLTIPAALPDEDALAQVAASFAVAAAMENIDQEPAVKEQSAFRESFVPDISISNPKLLQFAEMDDDRNNLVSGDTLLLIIEEDAEFAAILLQLARSRGFKAIVAFQGDQGLALAHAYKPDAILLDLHLPVLDGWSIISRLKSRPELRHIPVHVISTTEENQQSLAMGALSFWKKPSDQAELEASFLQIETYIRRPVKSLLIVEDNQLLRSSLVEFIAHPDVRIVAVGTGREAMEQLSSHHFDCMVLDLGLSDISGFDLLEQVKTNRKLQTLPVIIYTGKDLSKSDEQRLKHYAESIVIKNVRSMERLFDETALYLHRKHADLPPDKQLLIEKLHNPEAAFAGKSILLVDDDMRNIFALSSVLEGYNMEISFAQNGREALEHLEQHPETQLVFMDIMMPEMDGYETMKHIRSRPEYDQMVIIALTARALEEDRIKCLQAGASDYISKPINTTQLVTVLKVWLIQ